MAVNDNPYSGQPTYSRDMCSLMRRINALEARVSLVSGNFFAALDFDVSDGRVYVLAQRNLTGTITDTRTQILVHDATTGNPLDNYDAPVDLGIRAPLTLGVGDILQRKTKNARARMCVGDGYIYMIGNRFIPLEETAMYEHGRGRIYKFPVGGGTVEINSAAWPQVDYGDGGKFLKARCFGGEIGGREVNLHLPVGGIPEFDHPDGMQIHYMGGYIWGLMTPDREAAHFETYAVPLYAIGPGFLLDAIFGRLAHLCYASADLTDLGWVPYGEELLGPSGSELQLQSGIGSYYSQGALAAHDGMLYFDASLGAQDLGDLQPPFFGRVEVATHEQGEAEFRHLGFGLEEVPLYDRGPSIIEVCPHMLYATDGTYLFAWHEVINPYRLNVRGAKLGLRRFLLSTGAHVDDWGEADGVGQVLNMRCYDGVLWLLYAPEGGTIYDRARVEARDSTTMAVILTFNVGDALPQTQWFGYTGLTQQSLGDPDSGVSTPTDEALSSIHAAKSAQHILDMRNALRRVAPWFLAPSGLPLHLNGSDDDENLYNLAMGDRTRYGATGGYRTTWTRGSFDEMSVTDTVYIQEVTDRVFECIVDHVSSVNTRPRTGGNWTTVWREIDPATAQGGASGWVVGAPYNVHKTYDIDIGEIHECVTLLEGSSIGADPGA